MTEEQKNDLAAKQMENLCRSLQRVVRDCDAIDAMEPVAALAGVAGFVATILMVPANGDKDEAEKLLRTTFSDMVSYYIETAQRAH